MDMPFAPRKTISTLGQKQANRQIILNLLRRLRDGQTKFHHLVDHSRAIAYAINRLADIFSPALQAETEQLLAGLLPANADEIELESRLNQLFYPARIKAILDIARRIAAEAKAAQHFLGNHAGAIQSDYATLTMALTFTADYALSDDLYQDEEEAEMTSETAKLRQTLSMSLRRLSPLARASVALPAYLSDFVSASGKLEHALSTQEGMNIEKVLCLLLNVQQIISRAESLFLENARGFSATRLPASAMHIPSASAMMADPSIVDQLLGSHVPAMAQRH